MPDFPGFTRYIYAGTTDTDGSGGATGEGTLSSPSAPGAITNNDDNLNFLTDNDFTFGGATYILQGTDANGFIAAGTGGDTGTYYFSTDAGLNGGFVSYQQGGSFDLVCFATGTRIATPRGEVAVEALRVGDLVVVVGGAGPTSQPVVWIGRSRVNIARHPDRAAVAPIRIRAGALGGGTPHRDLRVSPEHALLLDGQLVPAGLLVNGTSIVRELWCPEETYWHVELATHGLLVADGAITESYFDDGNRRHFDNQRVVSLVKDFASERTTGAYDTHACRLVVREGLALDRIRARLVGAPAIAGDAAA